MIGYSERRGGVKITIKNKDTNMPNDNKEILTVVHELKELVKTFLEKQNSQHTEVMLALQTIQTKDEAKGKVFDETETDEELYTQAKECVLKTQRVSTSYLQRKLGIGYARAARLMNLLEEGGLIGSSKGGKPREVLRPKNKP